MSHRYTSYERDANGGDEAQARRYQSRWTRFSQPDLTDGSYDLTNPQSFNRYSYVGNDPVNFTDPSGLEGERSNPLPGLSDLPLPFIIPRVRPLLLDPPGVPPSRPVRVDVGEPPQYPGIFDEAYRDCLSRLNGAPAPGLVEAAAIVQAANSTGVDPTLLAFTWYEESGGFDFDPKNGLHNRNELIGDIGPGQIFPGIWSKSPFTDSLSNPFGTNREVGQKFNGNPVENLILAGRALNHPLGAVRGDKRAEAAGLYKAGSKSGPGYQTRVDKWNNANIKGYDAFFSCLKEKGF